MSIRINGKKYINGTVVRANPVEEATGTLEKIGIGSDVYEIQGSGSSSSGVYVEEELYSATVTSFVNISLDKSLLDYDMVVIYPDWDYTFNYNNIFNGTIFTKEQLIERAGTTNRIVAIIDSSHAAQYTLSADGKTLTAFSNSGATNIRWIVGIKTSGDYYSPVIYSTEEREIGVWTDNKPLYQKTVAVGALPNTTTKTVAHNISNIAFIAKVYGTAYSSTNGYTLPLEDTDADAGISGVIRVFANSTNVFISTKRDQSEYDVCFVTLQYTKTTDTAGSGSYNTLGVPTVHYTTDEQVIGTWVDGKPLYRRTFYYDNQSGLSSGDNKIIQLDSAINVTKLDGFLVAPDNNKRWILPYSKGSSTTSVIITDDHYINLYVNNDSWASTRKVYITIEYTKTTN